MNKNNRQPGTIRAYLVHGEAHEASWISSLSQLRRNHRWVYVHEITLTWAQARRIVGHYRESMRIHEFIRERDREVALDDNWQHFDPHNGLTPDDRGGTKTLNSILKNLSAQRADSQSPLTSEAGS